MVTSAKMNFHKFAMLSITGFTHFSDIKLIMEGFHFKSSYVWKQVRRVTWTSCTYFNNSWEQIKAQWWASHQKKCVSLPQLMQLRTRLEKHNTSIISIPLCCCSFRWSFQVLVSQRGRNKQTMEVNHLKPLLMQPAWLFGHKHGS